MSTARFPTSPKPDSGRFAGGARITLVEGTRHPNPPPAPAHLNRRERELYAEAWAEPESTLWRRADATRVARWARLAAKLEEPEPPSVAFTQIATVERALSYRTETWKLSRDPQFVAKVRDVVGLYRAIEFKKFLQTLDREVPDQLEAHLVLDNASTHKTLQIKKWLAAHTRSCCTSHPPRAPGSTSSSAGSPSSPTRSDAAAATARYGN